MPIYRFKHIADAKLDRLLNRIARMRRHRNDGPMLKSFGYDHGNGLIRDTSGKLDLLFEHNSDPVRSDAAAILCEIGDVSETLTELIHGYRTARKAGLLEDSILLND